MRKVIIIALVLWMGSGPAAAQLFLPDPPNPDIQHAEQYRACMALVHRSPEDAFDTALNWQGVGGGDAALHCIGAALIALGHHVEGAKRLQDLAQDVVADAAVKAGLLAQAGQGWLLADRPGEAVSAFSAALNLQPGDAEMLIDRAGALAALGSFESAEVDLDTAVTKAPDRFDAWLYRASVRRHLNKLEAALGDLDRALSLEPDQPDALLEKGNVMRLMERPDDARAVWLKVATDHPESIAAEAARANLERLELGDGTEPKQP